MDSINVSEAVGNLDVPSLYEPCHDYLTGYCRNGDCYFYTIRKAKDLLPYARLIFCNCTPPYYGKYCEYWSLHVVGSKKWWSLMEPQMVGFLFFAVVLLSFLCCVAYYVIFRKKSPKKRASVRHHYEKDRNWIKSLCDANNNNLQSNTEMETIGTYSLKVQRGTVKSGSEDFMITIDHEHDTHFLSPKLQVHTAGKGRTEIQSSSSDIETNM